MSNESVARVVRVWLTDGSGAPVTDLHALAAKHPSPFGLMPYRGAIDDAVPVGDATVAAERPDDVLFPEAEWCLSFPDGPQRYLADPQGVTSDTPVVFQGLIEGKWINRLGDTLEWQPASIGNNLLASGPGLRTTLGAIEAGAAGEVAVTYRYTRAGQELVRTQRAALSGLRGQNALDLIRAVLDHCRANGRSIDWIDFSAVGPEAAIVNEPARLQAAMRAAQVAPAEMLTAAGFRRLAPHLVRDILSEGIGIPPGTPCQISVRDGAGQTVGEGQLTWQTPNTHR